MPTNHYDDIALSHYINLGTLELSNERLRGYFSACFQQAIDDSGCYPAWTCITCIGNGAATSEFGELPQTCPVCGSSRVFEVATFQGRSTVVGKTFESAVRCLLKNRFGLPAVSTPGNTNTHDLEITARIAIETKGSPRQIRNPNGSISAIPRPGLERSDTWKKAQANAQNFRSRNRYAPFYIASNAVPPDLVGYRSDAVSGIFNVSQADRLQSLVDEIQETIST